MAIWMAEDFNNPAIGRYNFKGRYDYTLPGYSIGLKEVEEINDIAKEPWGWYFIGHQDRDYSSDTWYEKQHCVITFDSHEDLIQVVLQVGSRL